MSLRQVLRRLLRKALRGALRGVLRKALRGPLLFTVPLICFTKSIPSFSNFGCGWFGLVWAGVGWCGALVILKGLHSQLFSLFLVWAGVAGVTFYIHPISIYILMDSQCKHCSLIVLFFESESICSHLSVGCWVFAWLKYHSILPSRDACSK